MKEYSVKVAKLPSNIFFGYWYKFQIVIMDWEKP